MKVTDNAPPTAPEEKNPFTLENYREVVEPVLAATEPKECRYFHSNLNTARRQKGLAADKRTLLELFSNVTSFMLVSDSPNEPYKPILIMADGRRSALPQDLSATELDYLESVVPEIKDAELKARIADTLWALRHGKSPASNGRIAMLAYIESAERLLPQSWPYCRERLERALRLYLQLGMQKSALSEQENVPNIIRAYIAKEKSANTPFLVIHLIRLLWEAKLEDHAQHSKILEEIATAQEKAGRFDTARKAWELAGTLHKKHKSDADGLRCQISAAETYISEADQHEKKNNQSYMGVAHFLQCGVEAYRQISGHQKRKDALYTRLLEAQSKIKDELQTFSTQVDVTEIAKRAQAAVAGKDAFNAVGSLALMFPLMKIEEIKNELRKQSDIAPLSSIIPASIIDKQGKTIARLESEEDRMYSHVSRYWRSFYIGPGFWPALQKIREEHSLALEDWYGLLKHHPFVPIERVGAYAHAFFHGFHGDFMSAAHLLMPQIENSIRYVLQNFEKETSKPIAGGLQEESSLNQTLYFPELKEILGEDMVFELKGLLTEKAGDNLRNQLAHGLMEDKELYGHLPVYLYWITLYLVFLPLRASVK